MTEKVEALEEEPTIVIQTKEDQTNSEAESVA